MQSEATDCLTITKTQRDPGFTCWVAVCAVFYFVVSLRLLVLSISALFFFLFLRSIYLSLYILSFWLYSFTHSFCIWISLDFFLSPSCIALIGTYSQRISYPWLLLAAGNGQPLLCQNVPAQQSKPKSAKQTPCPCACPFLIGAVKWNGSGNEWIQRSNATTDSFQ